MACRLRLSSSMPNEVAERLTERALRFSVRIMRFCRTFHDTWEGGFVADQLFRAAARTAANYRAACRARSHRDFDNDIRNRRSEEHTSELQSQSNLVCRLLLEKK